MVEIFFDPTASATAYGQRPKFVRAEHSATAEGENCAYGPILVYHMTLLERLCLSLHAFLVRDSFIQNLRRDALQFEAVKYD